MSRATVASGRATLMLSVAVVLSRALKVETSQLKLLGVEFTEDQLNNGSLAILCFLFVSHMVNWIGDLSSLGKWNSGLSDKRHRALQGAGSQSQGQVEVLLERLNESLDQLKGEGRSEDAISKRTKAFEHIISDLAELEKSRWTHNVIAKFYVIGWYFIVPVVFWLWAVVLLCNG